MRSKRFNFRADASAFVLADLKMRADYSRLVPEKPRNWKAPAGNRQQAALPQKRYQNAVDFLFAKGYN
ncbi:MAG: hypothetical protein EGQ30_02480 [Clostridiales bacterium]|nr:hypothetical protein [Clostridiales bacterium]